MKSILFICTHNSARSQMAEAFVNTLLPGYRAYSAGTEPTTLNLYAITVMAEIGIDISGHTTKSVLKFKGKTFDYVVTVCDHAKETCPFFPRGKNIHKGFPDPSSFSGTDEEILVKTREIRDNIKEWVLITFGKE
jgi:arsenate reductase